MIIDTDDYIDASEAAQILGVTRARISYLCTQNKINGGIKFNRFWILPREEIIKRLNSKKYNIDDCDDEWTAEAFEKVRNNDPIVQKIKKLRRSL